MLPYAELDAIARSNGLCAFGVTSADPFPGTRSDLELRKAQGLDGGMQFTYRNPARSTDPKRTLPGAKNVLVGAYDYQREAPKMPGDGPQGRVAAYSWEDHYAALRAALEAVAVPIRKSGHSAIVLADQNNLVDRAVAYRAGIGWWGKSSNVLVPGVGSLVVLGSILTDAFVDYDGLEAVEDGCSSCTQCLRGCPTGAIVAPGVIDSRRCLAWLLQDTGTFPIEYRDALGDRLYGCDDCQDVCPPNQIRRRKPSDAGAGGAWVPVLEALALSDQALIERFGRWYIPNRDPGYLRRNLLVVLGNIGDSTYPGTTGILSEALKDERPLVRAHAVWAARRLGLERLLEDLIDEVPEVRVELERCLEPAGALPTHPMA